MCPRRHSDPGNLPSIYCSGRVMLICTWPASSPLVGAARNGGETCSVRERRELSPRPQSMPGKVFPRRHRILPACTWTCECHYSRICTWLRLHRCFVTTAINYLHSLGLCEDEVGRSGSSPSAWFSMAADTNFSVCATSSCLLMARNTMHCSILQNR